MRSLPRLLPLLAAVLLAGPAAGRAQYVGPSQPLPPPPPPAEVAEPDEAETPPEPPAWSPPPRPPAPEPRERRLRVWGTVGATFQYNQSAVSLGGGVGWFLGGGVLPTLDLSVAFGSAPTVFTVKPGLDWFLPVPGRVVPYIGGYWAHWFVGGGYPPQDAWGTRFGFSFAQAGPATLLVGVAYERVYTNCTGSCGYWIPTFAAGFAL